MHLGLSMRRPRDELQGEERSLHFGRDDRKHLRAVRGRRRPRPENAHDENGVVVATRVTWWSLCWEEFFEGSFV